MIGFSLRYLQLFLLTNSPYAFIDAGMRYLMEDHHWRLMFDGELLCLSSTVAGSFSCSTDTLLTASCFFFVCL